MRLPLLIATLLTLFTAPAHAALVWHWEDDFSTAEQALLQDWLTHTHAAIERWAGPYPFDVHVHLHRRDNAREPVPWANTARGAAQAVHFHVDPRYALADFLADWTAPHEFAHLLVPYLGRNNAWAAEGFASYLQHTLMAVLGVIDADEAQRRRDAKIERALAGLANEHRPLPEVMPRLRAEGKYPTFYWGGAVYWERVDAALAEQGSSLQAVLRDYLDCCRNGVRADDGSRTDPLDALAKTLDAVSQTQLFSDELQVMRETPGCSPRRGP